MEKISDEIFVKIISFTIDFETPSQFANVISQFASVSKKNYKMVVKNRLFLEEFYFSMFPSAIIPTTAVHDNTKPLHQCKVYRGKERYFPRQSLNEFGYISRGYRSCKYRCKDPSHYSSVKYRKMKSRFKDIYNACRKKYIVHFLSMTICVDQKAKNIRDRIKYAKRVLANKNLLKECEKYERIAKKRKYLKQIYLSMNLKKK